LSRDHNSDTGTRLESPTRCQPRERRSARREFANPCLLQQSDGVARRGSGFASGLDVCCHLSAMPLVLVCLLERLVATENDWGPNDGCALAPCSNCGEGRYIDGEDPDAARSNAEGGVMYICRRLRAPGNSTLESIQDSYRYSCTRAVDRRPCVAPARAGQESFHAPIQ
jgi:hypothetical protein